MYTFYQLRFQEVSSILNTSVLTLIISVKFSKGFEDFLNSQYFELLNMQAASSVIKIVPNLKASNFPRYFDFLLRHETFSASKTLEWIEHPEDLPTIFPANLSERLPNISQPYLIFPFNFPSTSSLVPTRDHFHINTVIYVRCN